MALELFYGGVKTRIKVFYLFLAWISLCIYGKVNVQNTCDLTGFITCSPGARYQLKVYNLLGQQVEVLLNEELPAGAYSVNFDAKGLPSGIYIYKLSGDNVFIIRNVPC